MIASRSIILKAASFQSAFLSSIERTIATSSKGKFTEVEFKMPWGKIAGKHWNPNGTQPILALHGWQDNAASFDHLVPLLPDKISVLAIDLPGHGLSSWLPDGTVYCRYMYIQVIERIRQHFGWEKIGLMGHSLGGMFTFNYSVLFPNNVKFATALDFYKFPTLDAIVHASTTATEMSTFLQLEKTRHPPSSFTEEQTIARLIEGNNNSLDETACRTLMTRGVTKKSDGSVYFSRDPRVKFLNIADVYTDEYMRDQVKRIKMPYMILKADDWHYNEPKSIYMGVLEAMKKSSSDLRFFMIPGKHHFHMMNPEAVAEVLIPFLEKYN